ncbi:hypothetical protein V5O48_016205 [Marasmius crinis-equi]|uniref:Glycoside hydrolase family 76 protein n=1 Tax=Marasmius crinis-equi TaxID=585013 RepID=A0ABR3ESF5_9AGAR
MQVYAMDNNDTFLKLAEGWWNLAQLWTVTNATAASKAAFGKNFTLVPSCSGHSIVGAMFYDKNPTDDRVAIVQTGEMLILSSLLAEATSNQTYLDQATDSFSFMRDVLLNTTAMIPLSPIHLNASDSDSCILPPLPTSSVNSGIWIEGIARFQKVAAGIARPDNELILESYVAAMSAPTWHSAEGILRVKSEDGETYHSDVNLPRGLGVLYQQTENSQFKSDINKYLAVQYNALLDRSTTNGSDNYSDDWNGPPNSTYDVDGQINALGVLIPVIALPDTNSTPPTSLSEKRRPIGEIVGGVVGGILVLAALIAVYLARRHWKRKPLPPVQPIHIEPFTQSPGLVAPSLESRQPEQVGELNETQNLYIQPYTQQLSQDQQSLDMGGRDIPSKHWVSGRTILGSAQMSQPVQVSSMTSTQAQDDRQLLGQMGATLNILAQRLARVEGMSTMRSETDMPPEYPGSIHD